MILDLPETFDKSEWTIIAGIVFNILIFTVLPKRIPKQITPLIVLLSISFPTILDHTIAVKPFGLYDLSDSYRYEIFDVILYGVYPAFGFLFVYIYEYFKFEGFKLFFYFIGWSIFAPCFELFLVKLDVYTYTGWKVVYSLPVYTIVLSLTFLFYKLVKFCYERDCKEMI
ncbi:hypothetical protein [Radiobacillus deserti]|uniref:Uncharacterized protein n=1 Tax=Radiobacillus deserti TaxID=2594883 RepID=A0A516KG08_9BACI|nr:hypothetical protein [Radiobacillus deserti]QDP40279.1 hypothetical protein FN924_08890 [Radiobacillus deserti]